MKVTHVRSRIAGVCLRICVLGFAAFQVGQVNAAMTPDTLWSIAKPDGSFALYRGASPVMTGASVVASSLPAGTAANVAVGTSALVARGADVAYKTVGSMPIGAAAPLIIDVEAKLI